MPAPREARTSSIRFSIFFFFCFAISIFVAIAASAQTSVNDVHIVPREIGPTHMSTDSVQLASNIGIPLIKSDVKLVLVPVSVTDPMQRVVTGLNQDNFEVFDGKNAQTIQHFSSEDAPVSVGIIVDSSGSMQDKWSRVRDAVNEFCEAANPQDEFFMISFSDVPRMVSDFTNSPEDLEKELMFTHPRGRTSLLDAIYMGIRKMKNAKYGRRALLIISDGGDNHSRYGEREIKASVKESDVMIYSIGTFDRFVPTPEEVRGPSLLNEIAEPTGGRAFTLDNVNSLPDVARHIGLELRTQYVLAYRPQNVPHDGKWHKIRVTLRLPKRFAFLQAHAKTGYLAAQN